jgi:hypothetical protein
VRRTDDGINPCDGKAFWNIAVCLKIRHAAGERLCATDHSNRVAQIPNRARGDSPDQGFDSTMALSW